MIAYHTYKMQLIPRGQAMPHARAAAITCQYQKESIRGIWKQPCVFQDLRTKGSCQSVGPPTGLSNTVVTHGVCSMDNWFIAEEIMEPLEASAQCSQGASLHCQTYSAPLNGTTPLQKIKTNLQPDTTLTPSNSIRAITAAPMCNSC